MKNQTAILKALGDENRLRISLMLKARPMCVCEIDSVLDIALSTVSAHLKTLRTAGVIKDTKDGRWIIYSINEDNNFAVKILEEAEAQLESNRIYIQDRKSIKEVSRESCSISA